MKLENDHYVVAGRPTKSSKQYEKRLESTERKLTKNPEIAESCQKVIKEHLEKKYIFRVPLDDLSSTSQWLLLHFPVVRPDKSTTKVRIVFDASATYQGRSLNTETLPGPKLQGNISDILVRFRKELVALAGDVSQMCHQVVLQSEVRLSTDSCGDISTQVGSQKRTSFSDLYLVDAIVRFALNTFGTNTHVTTKICILWQRRQRKRVGIWMT